MLCLVKITALCEKHHILISTTMRPNHSIAFSRSFVFLIRLTCHFKLFSISFTTDRRKMQYFILIHPSTNFFSLFLCMVINRTLFFDPFVFFYKFLGQSSKIFRFAKVFSLFWWWKLAFPRCELVWQVDATYPNWLRLKNH